MRHLYLTLITLVISFSFPKAYGQVVGPILGSPVVCAGLTTSLSDITAGGTWSSSNPAVGTVSSSGVVTGMVSGITTISYIAGATTVTQNVTVNAEPNTITGMASMCPGNCVSLSDATAGGVWSSSMVAAATIGSATGVTCAVATGTTIITYTVGTGCIATIVVTVNSLPTGILGVLNICAGSTTTLSDATGGGTWSSSNTSIATIGTSGVVTGSSAGTDVITYESGTGCYATTVVTVDPLPVTSAGWPTLCVGGTDTLEGAVGGTWIVSNPLVVTYGLPAHITGLATGTSYISYTLPTGCVSVFEVTVNATASPILGGTGLCLGGTTSLSDATGGGTWSSSNTTIGGVGLSSGVVNGNSVGTCDITYTAAPGCMASVVVTVNGSVAAVSGPSNLCIGVGYGFSDATSGGMWSSSNTDVTIGSSTGIILGVTAGTVYISYSLASGCTSTMLVTVDASPASIGGSTQVCEGTTTTLNDGTVGGTWISGSTPIATINSSTGLVTGISAGSVTMTYELSTGCMATMGMTVNPAPSPVSGSSTVCVGGTDTLSGFTGGTWSGGSSAATISTGGVITGVSAGSAMFTYTATTGCDITFSVTVIAAPASITGPSAVCMSNSITLSDATSGGTWSTTATTIVYVGSTTGVVTGLNAGTATISYSTGSGCYSATIVTVNPAPANITGATYVCAGSTVTLNDVTTGGTWSSSATGVATIGSSTGTVDGVSAGIVNITYQLGTGCSTINTFTVELPTLSVTTSAACGGSETLTATTSSTSLCSWSPSTGLTCSACDTTVANVTATTVYTVSVMDSFGCVNSTTVNVDGNRISGFITMTTTPTDTLKVWLIQFNPTDSSLTAEDSAMSCMDGGIPYYEFDNEPAGNYMVKAKLTSSVAGTSGYAPTYGLSTPYWDSAATIIHAAATDTQHINMIYGIVPPGPGFIGGLISSGAGRGTSGPAPVVGMLVYLEDSIGHIITYTYTGSAGSYAFNNLALGRYVIYPVAYQYKTVPNDSVTLTASADSFTTGNFYQNTTLNTITPTLPLVCCLGPTPSKIMIYPNPVVNELNLVWINEQTGNADLTITNITGEIVFKTVINISAASGSVQLDMSHINSGIYFVAVKSKTLSYTNKVLITH